MAFFVRQELQNNVMLGRSFLSYQIHLCYF